MHVYIYDDFLVKGKYTKILNRTETRLTDLGLSGKIVRLNNIKNFEGAIHGEIKRGAKTIVAVGNDATFHKVLNIVLSEEINFFFKDLFLAFIPVETTLIGGSLGINNASEACNILLARRNKKINVATTGKHFFISQAYINNLGTEIDIDSKFNVSPLEKGRTYIINLPSWELSEQIPVINPEAKNLYVYIPGKSGSFFTVQNLKIKNKDKPVMFLDNSTEIKLPIEVELAAKQVNIIVGKNRVFI